MDKKWVLYRPLKPQSSLTRPSMTVLSNAPGSEDRGVCHCLFVEDLDASHKAFGARQVGKIKGHCHESLGPHDWVRIMLSHVKAPGR